MAEEQLVAEPRAPRHRRARRVRLLHFAQQEVCRQRRGIRIGHVLEQEGERWPLRFGDLAPRALEFAAVGAGALQHGPEAFVDRQDADHDGDDAGDADECHERRAEAFAHITQIHERDGADLSEPVAEH